MAGPSPSAEALLQHVDFLRRLARALTANASDADDVVQDTLVAALERSQPPRNPRGWLSAVLRNRIARHRRAEVRERRRRLRAARPEHMASTDEMAQGLELQRRVVGAVLALKEPYRSSVFHRFYEGHTPAESARMLGVSVETVKTRLKRALAMLRARLHESHGDRALAPLLTPLFAREVKFACGVLVMTKKALVATALLAFAVSATLFAHFTREPEARERAGSRGGIGIEEPVGPAESATVSANAPAEPRGVKIGARQSTPPTSGFVVKRIIGPRGGSIPGVHLVIATKRNRIVSASDSDGAVRVNKEPRGPRRMGFAAWPASDNHYRTTPELISPDPGGARDDETWTFRGIAGRVVKQDGGPVETGLVVARREGDGSLVAHVPVASGGWFAFYGVKSGPYRLAYKIKIHGEEHGAVEGGDNVRDWQTDVILRILSGDTISGIVFDGGGRPKSGIRVRADLDGRAHTGVLTSEDGRFLIKGLVAGKTYSVMIWAKGFVPERRTLVPAGANDIRFELDPGLKASGRLLDENGKPKQVAQLIVTADDGRAIRNYPPTDAEGRFRLTGLPPGKIHLQGFSGDHKWRWVLQAGARDVTLHPDESDPPKRR